MATPDDYSLAPPLPLLASSVRNASEASALVDMDLLALRHEVLHDHLLACCAHEHELQRAHDVLVRAAANGDAQLLSASALCASALVTVRTPGAVAFNLGSDDDGGRRLASTTARGFYSMTHDKMWDLLKKMSSADARFTPYLEQGDTAGSNLIDVGDIVGWFVTTDLSKLRDAWNPSKAAAGTVSEAVMQLQRTMLDGSRQYQVKVTVKCKVGEQDQCEVLMKSKNKKLALSTFFVGEEPGSDAELCKKLHDSAACEATAPQLATDFTTYESWEADEAETYVVDGYDAQGYGKYWISKYNAQSQNWYLQPYYIVRHYREVANNKGKMAKKEQSITGDTLEVLPGDELVGYLSFDQLDGDVTGSAGKDGGYGFGR